MKDTYHHGNLRQDLLEVSVSHVRRFGLGSLSAREIAREVGVSPAAMYRHYPDLEHLKAHVSQRAREELARTMIDARDAVRTGDRTARTLRRFEATGVAYIEFAAEHPELFAAAFAPSQATLDDVDDPSAWEVLFGCLDDLVEVGLLPADRRPDAPMMTWTATHGLASLVALSALPPDVTRHHATDLVLRGIKAAIGVSSPTPR